MFNIFINPSYFRNTPLTATGKKNKLHLFPTKMPIKIYTGYSYLLHARLSRMSGYAEIKAQHENPLVFLP